MDHKPVLVESALQYLVTDRSGVYFDGTCGLGGHARRILEELTDDGRLICIDRDVIMLEAARSACQSYSCRARFERCSYHEIDRLTGLSISSLSGILLDLGICSGQLEDSTRGFSYRFDARLDMRFDQQTGMTAAEYLSTVSAEHLATALRDYGDFSSAAQLAARIIERRRRAPIETVGDLVSAVDGLFPVHLKNKHTARLLQSVRIAVNDELRILDEALPLLVEFLKPGGRLAVISYHSQEDRRVKRFIRNNSRVSGLPPEIEAGVKGTAPTLRAVTRHAVKADAEEVAANPRARSARLRVAEKLKSS